ncbi:hypothetical protein K458DRAFT_466550 [Lentithecium fluviatile CBS 122367]|uniref:Uncharacterized protein n=1 Tax=Lentithecium fluviatile CBS 122367 TaxID=1168545 RepID=A0A6G1IGW6_9PLEO|nr:hypothetical protein K458DRAFT_466550 [Lentithecium fluviatile CBS 122367]
MSAFCSCLPIGSERRAAARCPETTSDQHGCCWPSSAAVQTCYFAPFLRRIAARYGHFGDRERSALNARAVRLTVSALPLYAKCVLSSSVANHQRVVFATGSRDFCLASVVECTCSRDALVYRRNPNEHDPKLLRAGERRRYLASLGLGYVFVPLLFASDARDCVSPMDDVPRQSTDVCNLSSTFVGGEDEILGCTVEALGGSLRSGASSRVAPNRATWKLGASFLVQGLRLRGQERSRVARTPVLPAGVLDCDSPPGSASTRPRLAPVCSTKRNDRHARCCVHSAAGQALWQGPASFGAGKTPLE